MSAACASRDLEVGHRVCGLIDLRRADPARHVRRRVRQRAGEIDAARDAVERRADVAVGRGDAGNRWHVPQPYWRSSSRPRSASPVGRARAARRRSTRRARGAASGERHASHCACAAPRMNERSASHTIASAASAATPVAIQVEERVARARAWRDATTTATWPPARSPCGDDAQATTPTPSTPRAAPRAQSERRDRRRSPRSAPPRRARRRDTASRRRRVARGHDQPIHRGKPCTSASRREPLRDGVVARSASCCRRWRGARASRRPRPRARERVERSSSRPGTT